MRQHADLPVEFKALDEKTGVFEALVAVYGNVDYAGDRLVKGCFDDTLAEWKASGRPIPIVWSHQWDDLNANVGEVLEAKSIDEGLWVKGQLYVEEDFAGRVYKRMLRGVIKEFSFGYKVAREGARMVNGVREILKTSLYEIGPCLKGVNPETALLAVKAGRVLSNANEKALRDAVAVIHSVLAAVETHYEEPATEGEGEKAEEKAATAAHAPRRKHAEQLRLLAELSELGV